MFNNQNRVPVIILPHYEIWLRYEIGLVTASSFNGARRPSRSPSLGTSHKNLLLLCFCGVNELLSFYYKTLKLVLQGRRRHFQVRSHNSFPSRCSNKRRLFHRNQEPGVEMEGIEITMI